MGLEFGPQDSGQLGKVSSRQEWVCVSFGAVCFCLCVEMRPGLPVAWKLILEARAEFSVLSRQEYGIHASFISRATVSALGGVGGVLTNLLRVLRKLLELSSSQ